MNKMSVLVGVTAREVDELAGADGDRGERVLGEYAVDAGLLLQKLIEAIQERASGLTSSSEWEFSSWSRFHA